MLELRPVCEHCGKTLPANSTEAMICSYECTFCKDCVEKVLLDVCPNCGGGFTQRPVRPKDQLKKHPPTLERIWKPVNKDALTRLQLKFGNVPPEQR